MKNVLLIGCGEVGSAIKQLEEEAGNEVHIIELGKELPSTEMIYDVAHVNIPFGEKFIDIVCNYIH